MSAALQSEADLATLVTRSMKEKDNGSVELLLVLDGVLQVGFPTSQHPTFTCTPRVILHGYTGSA